MKKISLILLIFAFLVSCASTGQSPVGEAAPDFSVTDVSGDDVRLSEFKGKKNVVLVFYSESTWPDSRRQLGELQENISEIENLDAKVIAFATSGNQDDVEISKSFHDITFSLIPTPNKSIAKDFGVQTYATIIIDKNGVIRLKQTGYMDSASNIITELQTI